MMPATDTVLTQFSPLYAPKTAAYSDWRAKKLAWWPSNPDALKIGIESLETVPMQKIHAIKNLCEKTNIAIYECENDSVSPEKILTFSKRFGLGERDMHLLSDEDGITALENKDKGADKTYIPYTNKGLNWHTDGYYNDPSHRIRSMLLHCERAAERGGETSFLDPEIAYIYLCDENPAYIEALSHPETMTIPANIEAGQNTEIRPVQSGPVFELDDATGHLYMRYTTRKRNVEWRNDPITQDALAFLRALLDDEDGPALSIKLQPGQGILTNNALHCRTAFEDSEDKMGRRLYRGRFFDRIADPQ